jgi:glycosyltransferase involved in cell wall biosynthesis
MKRIVVEGWRFLSHSFGIVNQYQCLELLNRPDVELYHRDAPYFSKRWRPMKGLFPDAQEARLRAIPAPPAGLRPDAVLRMAVPFRLRADPEAARTFLWGTAEFGMVADAAVWGRRPAREALPRTQATIITSSNWSRDGFVRSGAPPDKVVVVPCGVDTAVFKPPTPEERDALRKRFKWEGKLVVLNIGVVTRNKGIVELLKAVAALADRFPRLQLALKGADRLYSSKQFLQQWFGRLPPGDAAKVRARLRYVGDALSAATMASLYQAADVYVSPYQAEGFNMPVLEAMACGLPVICTKGGPTDEFTHPDFAMRIDSKLVTMNEEEGKIRLAPDVDHLIALMAEVAGNDAFRSQARTAAPAFVATRFTWKHVVDRLLQIITPD